MRKEREILYYENYFIDFFMSLEDGAKKKISYVLDMLKTQERLNKNFVKMIRDGVYELRASHNGNVYWATKTQVNNSDFYVIDIKGLKHLQDTYRDRKIITIYVETNEATRRLRMEERGDSEEKIEERIKNDKEAFADVDYQHWDCIIRNSRHSDLSVIAMKLNDVIKSFESKEE